MKIRKMTKITEPNELTIELITEKLIQWEKDIERLKNQRDYAIKMATILREIGNKLRTDSAQDDLAT